MKKPYETPEVQMEKYELENVLGNLCSTLNPDEDIDDPFA